MSLKQVIKRKLKRFINSKPVPAMSPDNVYAYLDALYKKRNLDGPILEIGCAYGGTTAVGYTFLTRIGVIKDYYCIDTFSGFKPNHLNTDHKLGLSSSHDKLFSDNSIEQVRENLFEWGISERIHLIKEDICTIDESKIPSNISVCLLDVDLRDPIYYGLKKVLPKLADGGVVLIDDCKKDTSWVGANIGYNDFIKENNIDPKYYMGFGVIEKNNDKNFKLNWEYSTLPNKAIGGFYNKKNQT